VVDLRPRGGGMEAAGSVALAWSFCKAKTPMLKIGMEADF
jgi:hypothetical protein